MTNNEMAVLTKTGEMVYDLRLMNTPAHMKSHAILQSLRTAVVNMCQPLANLIAEGPMVPLSVFLVENLNGTEGMEHYLLGWVARHAFLYGSFMIVPYMSNGIDVNEIGRKFYARGEDEVWGDYVVRVKDLIAADFPVICAIGGKYIQVNFAHPDSEEASGSEEEE